MMNRIKLNAKVMLLGIGLLCGYLAFSDTFSINVDILRTYHDISISKMVKPYRSDNYIYFGGTLKGNKLALYRLNLNTEVIKLEPKTYVIIGVLGSSFIVQKADDSGYAVADKYYYFNNDRIVQEFVFKSFYLENFIEYQNDKIFCRKNLYEDLGDLVLFNLNKNNFEYLGYDGEIVDISPDKMHLLIIVRHTDFIVYNIQEKKEVTRIKLTHIGAENDPRFLTNTLISDSFENFREVWTLSGEFVGDFIFQNDRFNPTTNRILNNELTLGLLSKRIRTSETEHALIDLTPFRQKLDSLGLLFHPMAGVVNDSSVRLRANPNLEAKTLGFLSRGDQVTVLDRSSIKVAIGDMKDYWYKVITKEEKTGWSYGAFIDLVALETIGPVGITHISASSTLTDPLDKNMYQPIKAFDGKPDTAWVENVDGAGVGSTLKVELEQPITIDRIKLMPGWFEKKYWKQFYRIKRMGIQLDDYKVTANFKDTMEPQEVRLAHPVTFKHAEFMIRMVYPTSKWDDTALAEVEFYYKDHKIPLDISKFADQLKVEPEEDN